MEVKDNKESGNGDCVPSGKNAEDHGATARALDFDSVSDSDSDQEVEAAMTQADSLPSPPMKQ